MRIESQVGVGNQDEQLTPDKRIRNAQRLMDRFSKILGPALARLNKPSRADYPDLLNTQAARDAAIMGGRGAPPILELRRGRYVFQLINYVDSPEVRTLALSIEDGKNPRELVALIDGRDSNNGSIKHIRDHSSVANTVAAVKLAEGVLRKFEHPLLFSTFSFVKETASFTLASTLKKAA